MGNPIHGRFYSLLDAGFPCSLSVRISHFNVLAVCSLLSFDAAFYSPVKRAWGLWKDMFIWGVQPNTSTYNAMIKLCADTNQYEQAMTFLDDMDMNDHRVSRLTMEILIRAAATAPQWIRVRETLCLSCTYY